MTEKGETKLFFQFRKNLRESPVAFFIGVCSKYRFLDTYRYNKKRYSIDILALSIDTPPSH